MKLKQLILLCALTLVSVTAIAATEDDGINRASKQNVVSPAALNEVRAANVEAACASAACDCDIAKDISDSNKALQDELTIFMTTVIDKPVKSSEVDCISQLTSLSFGFNLPSASELLDSIMDQAKDAVCNIAKRQIGNIKDSIGISNSRLNTNFGGRYNIPGTRESINVDGGGVSGGFNNSVSRGSSSQGAATLKTTRSQGPSGTSGSVDVTGGGDVDDFLGDVFK